MTTLYPPIEPHSHGMLDVGDGNRLYWEECGNPRGKPALVLHGGPGSGRPPGMRRVGRPPPLRQEDAGTAPSPPWGPESSTHSARPWRPPGRTLCPGWWAGASSPNPNPV